MARCAGGETSRAFCQRVPESRRGFRFAIAEQQLLGTAGVLLLVVEAVA
jgi:hypothetical protein